MEYQHVKDFFSRLLPPTPGLIIDDITWTPSHITVCVRSTQTSSVCPACSGASSRNHSRYQRTLLDLPVAGTPVSLVLTVRKFFCTVTRCSRRIFTERLPTLTAPHARKTTRFVMALRSIAFACGGEAGAQLVPHLALQAKLTTLITLIHTTPLPHVVAPRIIGVDDRAKRKGCSYGTIIVDLARHCPIALLPERTAEPLAAWLQDHPSVTVVTRDRSETYTTAITRGAPQARQIADRWHLLHNWSELVERVLNRHQSLVEQVTLPQRLSAEKPATTLLLAKTMNRQRKYQDERRIQVRSEREERYRVIQARVQKGEYLTTIARDLQLDYKTVRKYAQAESCPYMKPYPPRRRMLEPYLPYIHARWAEGCRNGQQIYREIATHGFQGSRVVVAQVIAQLRRELKAGLPPEAHNRRSLTIRDGLGLFMRRPEELSGDETTALAELAASHTELIALATMTKEFTTLIRERQAEAFDPWLARTGRSSIPEVRNFAIQVKKDVVAVRAACEVEWSHEFVAYCTSSPESWRFDHSILPPATAR